MKRCIGSNSFTFLLQSFLLIAGILTFVRLTSLLFVNIMDELYAGATLQGGKYTIERMLGQGGFGITYLGTQAGLNRRVAIKEFFMRAYCNRDADTSYVSVVSQGSREEVERFRQKFVKEAQTISALDNPHIVRVYDVFEENGTAYYVMEYIEGGSLKDLLHTRGPLPEAEAVDYIRQLADALAYIHSQKLLHLDLKPANVLLKGGHTAVLIDFGVSKHYDNAGGQTSSTPAGVSAGYAPLEQYVMGGIAHFKPCTDLYALGATLYCLLCGQAPPEAGRLNEEGLPPLPRPVSRGVETAIRQALQVKQKDRPQTVKEFLDLLSKSGEAVSGKTGGNREETMTPDTKISGQSSPKRHTMKIGRWVWGLVAAVVLVVFGIVFAVQYSREKEPVEGADLDTIVQEKARWGNEQEAIASAKQSILDRLQETADVYEGNDLDSGLLMLLRRYSNEVNDLYGTPQDPVKDGIWHIGNDCWKPSLRFLSVEKEMVPVRYGKVYLYKVSFELYYDTHRAGIKEIKVTRQGDTFMVWDIRADNAEHSSSVWVREALTDYYAPHFS